MTNLTLENLYFIERQCLNPQDAIIIRLLMEGVEIHEIVYLKKRFFGWFEPNPDRNRLSGAKKEL